MTKLNFKEVFHKVMVAFWAVVTVATVLAVIAFVVYSVFSGELKTLEATDVIAFWFCIPTLGALVIAIPAGITKLHFTAFEKICEEM